MSNAIKFLVNTIDSSEIEYLSEAVGSDGHQKKWKARGPFIQAEKTNRNGRTYRKALCEREVKNYNRDFIQPGFSHGCLGHPPTPATDESKISHYLSELKMDGSLGMGELVLMDTTCGVIAQKIFESGKRLCVSTRGTGSLDNNGYVNDDFNLIAVDLVHVPSGSSCTLDAVLEAKDWIVSNNQANGRAYEQLEKSLAKNGSRELKRDLIEFFKSII